MNYQITINGQALDAREGMTVVEAARAHGIEIPTLCAHPNLRPAGSCRLCLVEVEPQLNLATACTLQVREGLAVQTETPRLVEMRKAILELLLEDYADSGYAAGDRKNPGRGLYGGNGGRLGWDDTQQTRLGQGQVDRQWG